MKFIPTCNEDRTLYIAIRDIETFNIYNCDNGFIVVVVTRYNHYHIPPYHISPYYRERSDAECFLKRLVERINYGVNE